MEADLKSLTQRVINFRDARNWKQFHTAKDMMLSLVLEASELAEHSQWKTDQQFNEQLPKDKVAIADELSDVLYWLLLLAHDLDINLTNSFEAKMLKNEEKYPVDLARSNSAKYSALRD